MTTTNARANTLKIRTTEGLRLGRIVLVSGIGIIAFILLVKMIRKGRAVSSASRAATDPNVQLATRFNTAIHPARTWIGYAFAGADKDEIFRIAKEVTNFKDVSTEYYNLYEESLTHEIQDALGEDYQQFLNIISGEGITSTQANNLAKRLYKAYNGLTGFFVVVSESEASTIREYSRLTSTDQKMVQATYSNLYKRNLLSDLQEIKVDLTSII